MKLTCALLSLSVFFLASCEKVVVNRGYVIETADFAKISVGHDDAQSVFDKVGSPTIRSSVIGASGEYRWYYVSKKMEKAGFLDPKAIDQKTIIVTFDSNDVVKSVDESSYEKDIQVIGEKTKTEGKDAGILGETFGGLGKYMKRYKSRD